MFNKTIVAAALLGLGLSTAAVAAPANPTADVVFEATMSNSVDSDSLAIRGAGGNLTIGNGDLEVTNTGVFTTTSPVTLETWSLDANGDNDVQTASQWAVTGVVTKIDGLPTADADVKVTDRNGVISFTDNAGTSDGNTADTIVLDVANTETITDVPVNGLVQVTVSMVAGASL